MLMALEMLAVPEVLMAVYGQKVVIRMAGVSIIAGIKMNAGH